MSFNRGLKRNSFGNRSFGNRNSGGGGGVGGGGGGNSGPGGVGMGGVGSGGGGNRGMNPWESGVMPGRGILPTPSNSLSLNSPQAQLVIASNLLSNLLRNQQDSPSPVPSLLSLGNNMNGPGSNFRGQQNFSSGRFNDRQMRNNPKNQRPQPYNKMGNRARDSVAGRRGPSAQQSRAQSQSGNQRINGNQSQHRNDKTNKPNPASKQNQTVKKEQQDVKPSDNEKAEPQPVAKSNEENNEKPEDSKPDETHDGDEVAVNKEGEEKPAEEETEAAAAADSTATATSPAKKNDGNQSSGQKSKARHAESRYAAVPISHMFCHLCNKHMWDGFSFENHLRGRAHQLMMDKQDESYKLRVDFMRHELKVSEEQRELSLHNSKRRGKKVSVDLSVREYCPMCDLNFYGTLSSHRKSQKHQQLKIFLHPRCIPCAKEFPSRIEYDEHCLTPSHMSNAARNDKNELVKGESEIRTAEDEEKDTAVETKSNDKEEELPENKEYIFDIVEDMDMTKYKTPSFKYCRQKEIGVGASMVKEVQGYHCEKCRRFMLTEDDMKAHLRTVTHHRNFSALVKSLTPVVTETVAEKPVEEATATAVEEEDAVKDSEDQEGESAAKRRKTDEPVADEPAVTNKDETIETSEAANEDEKNEEDDKYDPMEADAESEEDGQAAAVKEQPEAINESTTEQPVEVSVDGVDKTQGEKLNDSVKTETPVQTAAAQPPVTPQKPTPQVTPQSTPQPTPQATPQVTSQATPQATSQATPQATSQATPQATSQATPQVTPQSTPQSTPQQKTPGQLHSILKNPMDSNQMKNKISPGNNSNQNTQGKSPRGRGFRGRGHQRARRSRR